jgi:hypothetical protein
MELKSYKVIAYLWSISASKHIHHSIYLEPFYKICFYLFAAIFYMLTVFLAYSYLLARRRRASARQAALSYLVKYIIAYRILPSQ